jgi:uncharacterized membrane protein
LELKSETKKTGEDLELIEFEPERVNHSTWLERSSFRIVLISVFTALAIVLGYILAYIPNIELFTLIIFLSGFILGKRDGMIVGFLSSFIFCFFNPLGASPLPLLTFQLIHYSITGLLGALINDLLQRKKMVKLDTDLYIFPVMAILGVVGALITLNFQIFATLLHFLSFFGTSGEFLPLLLSGLGFTVIHIIGNTLGFIFILPGLIQLVNNMIH